MSISGYRAAYPEDAGAISALVNSAYRPLDGNGGWTHESDLISGDRISEDQVMGLLAQPDSALLLGLIGDKIAACVHVALKEGRTWIGMLSVIPALQNAGIGSQMLVCAESHARDHFGPQDFFIVVVSDRSELIAFYKRRGYQPAGIQMDYPHASGIGIPRMGGLKIEILKKTI